MFICCYGGPYDGLKDNPFPGKIYNKIKDYGVKDRLASWHVLHVENEISDIQMLV